MPDVDHATLWREARERTEMRLKESRRRCPWGCGSFHYSGAITEEWPEGFVRTHDGMLNLAPCIRDSYEGAPNA